MIYSENNFRRQIYVYTSIYRSTIIQVGEYLNLNSSPCDPLHVQMYVIVSKTDFMNVESQALKLRTRNKVEYSTYKLRRSGKWCNFHFGKKELRNTSETFRDI